ncbi:flagellar hook protein FlgK [Mesorhizobium sp. L-8-10]|uniref:flagellar hook-associated protein FlgK n=1 Tax=Mesorhizobium sp. L-8-10 TaxID=2744523 RepID=UPI0019292E4F|nr:flagellar hook-associated protein FlgK [Mesorhizobium sp. L-8-10]BCH30948.1 flagellar hook protein FlgK [Mesorhizobium sp. L-8-10]
MSLTTALGIAQRSILSTSRQTSIVSQNISNVQNPDYSRRSAVLVSTAPGARTVEIQRATNVALFKNNLAALSSHAGQSTLLSGIENLTLHVNGVENGRSASTLIGKLQQALQSFGTTPSNENLGENVVEQARQLAKALNEGSAAIQQTRAQLDKDIKTSVASLNDLLGRFEQANKAVMHATQAGNDASDALDQRDALLKQISEIVPISTITRGNNDMVVTTASGVTLFEAVPRKVTFEPIPSYSATTSGNAIYVDGVPLVAGSGANTDAAGSLAAMLQMRDSVAPSMQAQLDEIARGLISSFAETDPTGAGSVPPLTGLFTWPGGPALPADGTVSPGLAGAIQVNPLIDSTAGGDVTLLRDGGINGSGYVYNTSGGASFADLIYKYSEALDAPMTFDAAAGIGTEASVTDYAGSSISWLELARQQASEAAESKSSLLVRTSQALSNETGVNMDEEMARLLELEHAYQASARLIQAVDEMLSTLLEAVR